MDHFDGDKFISFKPMPFFRADSNDTGLNAFSRPIRSNELSTDCFLPVESTDSFPHDFPLDTGGVTIPAHHSDEAQFPMFEFDFGN